MVFTQSVQSLMELGWGNRIPKACAEHGFEAIDLFWSTNWPRVDALRDQAVDCALRDGFSHLLFLDADMVWPTDVLSKMLRHHSQGIVGGLYFLKGKPWAPVAMKGLYRPEGSTVDQWYRLDTYPKDELLDVDILGMGCTLIPTAVFAAMGARPWFEYENDDEGWPKVSEDVPFCRRAAAAGFSLYLDPSVKCGHVHTQIIDEKYHKRFQASVRETEKRMNVTVDVPADLDAVSELETKNA